jgi:hypothetical protein
MGNPCGGENVAINSLVYIPSINTMSRYSSPQIDQDTKDQETKNSYARPPLLCSIYTREGELCVYANERNLSSIYTHNLTPEKMQP